MSLNPEAILDQLLKHVGVPLGQLVGGGGLYSLSDEKGTVRYIGETGMPFFKRIHNYHCAGDDNSHKFSTVFNAGRLWQMSSVDISPSKRAINDHADGRTAKELRCAFARSRCLARIVDLPHLSTMERKALESAVLALTPPDNRRWNDARVLEPYEPEGLDDFIAGLGWTPDRIEAVVRQGARWDSLPDEHRIVVRKRRVSKAARG